MLRVVSWSILGRLIISVLLAPLGALAEPLSLEWPKIPQATGYDFKLKNSAGKQVLKKRVRHPRWQGEVPPGKYLLNLRSLDNRKVAGPWSPEIEVFVFPKAVKIINPKAKLIGKKGKSTLQVRTQWKPVSGAKTYLMEVFSQDKKRVHSQLTDIPKTDIELKVAQNYRIKITGLPDGFEAKTSEELKRAKTIEKRFAIFGHVASPAPIPPTHPFIESIQWEPVSQATSYRAKLYRQKDKKWLAIKKKNLKGTKYLLPKGLPGGNYKVKLVSRGKLRKSMPPKTLIFELAKKRGPAALHRAEMKQSVQRPHRFHLAANYIITQLSYASQNAEQQTSTGFDALGGAGRLGLGYTPKNSKWGAMGYGEFSGFTVSGQTFTYFSLESNLTYRKSLGLKSLILNSGLFYKQLPQADTSITDSGKFELQAIDFAGPTVGASIAWPLSPKLGVKAETRLYYSLLTMSSPNGQPLNPTLSYTMSLMGSYRWSHKLTGLFGYTLKNENVEYQAAPASVGNDSFAAEGELNSVDISGHYLTFALEWGF